MVRDALARGFTNVTSGVLLHVRTPFRISETAGRIALNFGTYAVRDPLDKRFTESPIMLAFCRSSWWGTRARAHVLTRLPFSGTAGRIALEIGVLLGDH